MQLCPNEAADSSRLPLSSRGTATAKDDRRRKVQVPGRQFITLRSLQRFAKGGERMEGFCGTEDGQDRRGHANRAGSNLSCPVGPPFEPPPSPHWHPSSGPSPPLASPPSGAGDAFPRGRPVGQEQNHGSGAETSGGDGTGLAEEPSPGDRVS